MISQHRNINTQQTLKIRELLLYICSRNILLVIKCFYPQKNNALKLPSNPQKP